MAETKIKIIACQVFTDELLAVLPEKYKNADILWLDAGLHWNLDKLETQLSQALEAAEAEGAQVKFLYGRGCHPDICPIADKHGGKILTAQNCVEAFCPKETDDAEQGRTMVITPGWIRASANMMAEAGYDEVDIRQNFGFYDRFVLKDTGVNPLTEEEILEFYDLIQVPIEIEQISLDYFRDQLSELLE